jgi:hypothetical protein
VEAGVWATALREGWLRDKARAVAWLVRHRHEVEQRRRWVQRRRRVGDAALLGLLELRIEPSPRVGTRVPDVVNLLVETLGRLAGADPARTSRCI